MSRSALERQASRAARSGMLPAPTSAPAGFLTGVDEIAEEQQEQEEARNNLLPIHGNDRTFNLNTLLAQTILASEYFKSLVGITSYLEVSWMREIDIQTASSTTVFGTCLGYRFVLSLGQHRTDNSAVPARVFSCIFSSLVSGCYEGLV